MSVVRQTASSAAVFAAVFALILLAVIPTPAHATPSQVSAFMNYASPAHPSATLTWRWSNYQTTTSVKCVKVAFSDAPTGGAFPAGMNLTGVAFGGSYLSGQTYVLDSSAISSGVAVFNNPTGVVPSGSGKTINVGSMHNPSAAGTYYASVTTYDAAGNGSSGACAGSILDGNLFCLHDSAGRVGRRKC